MAAPTITQIREAIKAKIVGLDNPGPVHDYERHADDIATLITLYKASDDKLRGWHIRRVSTREASSALGRALVTHRWQIRALQGFEDDQASEKAFDLRIEQLRDAVRADDALGLGASGVTTITEDAAGIQVDDSGPAMFAGALCHFARLTLYTRHPQ